MCIRDSLYAFETSFGNEVFKQSADGSYTSDLTLGGEGASEFTQWLKAQGEAKTPVSYTHLDVNQIAADLLGEVLERVEAGHDLHGSSGSLGAGGG